MRGGYLLRISKSAAWALLVSRVHPAAATLICQVVGVQRRPLRFPRSAHAQRPPCAGGVEGERNDGCPLGSHTGFEEQEEWAHVRAVGKVAGVVGGGPNDAAPRGYGSESGWGERAPAAAKGGNAEEIEDDEGGDGAEGGDAEGPDVAVFDAGGRPSADSGHKHPEEDAADCDSNDK